MRCRRLSPVAPAFFLVCHAGPRIAPTGLGLRSGGVVKCTCATGGIWAFAVPRAVAPTTTTHRDSRAVATWKIEYIELHRRRES